ncbi:MAG: helix-turn-helix transcriptional regulator, partial [Chloroflexota bacterium]|nr:helix-turn-helix transcriptional regulator [Chloroflexota bacterium]
MDEDLERKVELLASLTVRQRQVVKLVLDGLSNAQIAEALGRIERTVEEHLRAIYRHLGLEQYPPRSRRVGLVRDFYGAFQAFQLPGRGPAQTSGLIPAPEPEASAEEFIADAIASGSYPLVPVRVHDYRTGGSVIIPVPVSDDLRDDEPDVIEGTATVHESAELGWWTPFPDSGEDPDWRRERRLLVIAGVVVALARGGFALRQHASPAASAATSQSPLSKQTAS